MGVLLLVSVRLRRPRGVTSLFQALASKASPIEEKGVIETLPIAFRVDPFCRQPGVTSLARFRVANVAVRSMCCGVYGVVQWFELAWQNLKPECRAAGVIAVSCLGLVRFQHVIGRQISMIEKKRSIG